MMAVVDLAEKLWPMLIGILGQFAWIIRLEAKVLYMEKDLKNYKLEQKEKWDEHNSAIWKKLERLESGITTILQSISRLEERTNKQ